MLGKWIRPWPGESVVGEVVSVEGENLVCRTWTGQTFIIPMRGQLVETAEGKPMRLWRERKHGEALPS
jgi:hypothetical protein